MKFLKPAFIVLLVVVMIEALMLARWFWVNDAFRASASVFEVVIFSFITPAFMICVVCGGIYLIVKSKPSDLPF